VWLGIVVVWCVLGCGVQIHGRVWRVWFGPVACQVLCRGILVVGHAPLHAASVRYCVRAWCFPLAVK